MIKNRKFRYEDYRGIGCIIGHRNCIPKVTYPLVPKIMGWLWTAKDTPGHKYDPDWKPGAVHKNARRKKQRKSKDQESEHAVEVVKKIKKKKKGHFVASVVEGQEEEEEKFEPAFVVRKRDGNIHVTIQPIKEDPDRHVSDYPYEDKKPFHIKVQNQTQDQMDKMARKKERQENVHKTEACVSALDEICNDLYQYMDQDKFSDHAEQHEECPCAILQSELLKYLICSYAQSNSSLNKSKSSAESENCIPDDLIENLIECLVDCEKSDDQDDDFSCVESSSGRWSIEFNPPNAKWDSEATKTSVHKRDRATQFGEPEASEVEEILQKGGKRKTLYFNPNFRRL